MAPTVRGSVLPYLALCALVATGGCSEEIESDSAEGARPAERIRLASSVPGTSGADGHDTYLYSERDVDVFAQIGGGELYEVGVVVTGIHAELGDRVRKGQLLATLEDEEAALEVEMAEAAADEARADFERIDQLRERDLVSAADHDQARHTLRRAEAQLKRARLDLSRTRVRAPFDGRVSRRYVRVGELVTEGTPLFRVTAMSPLRARLLVPESRASRFVTGAPVEVRGAAGATATARIILVGPTVDPGSGTREVVLELAEPGDFRPGASITVESSPVAARAGER